MKWKRYDVSNTFDCNVSWQKRSQSKITIKKKNIGIVNVKVQKLWLSRHHVALWQWERQQNKSLLGFFNLNLLIFARARSLNCAKCFRFFGSKISTGTGSSTILKINIFGSTKKKVGNFSSHVGTLFGLQNTKEKKNRIDSLDSNVQN